MPHPLTLGVILPDNENLPTPPLLVHWLLEQPLPLVIVLVSIGAVTLLILLSQGEGRRAMMALGGFAAAVGLLLLVERLVVTDRERIAAGSRQFVQRFIAADAQEVRELMDQNVTLKSGGQAIKQDGQWLVGVAGAMKGEIVSHGITQRGALVDTPNSGRTRFSVRTQFGQQSFVSGTVNSTWELSWRKSPDGQWRINGMECLSIFGQRPSREWVDWGERLLVRGR